MAGDAEVGEVPLQHSAESLVLLSERPRPHEAALLVDRLERSHQTIFGGTVNRRCVLTRDLGRCTPQNNELRRGPASNRLADSQLKLIVVDLTLDNAMLQDVLQKILRPVKKREMASPVPTLLVTSIRGSRAKSKKHLVDQLISPGFVEREHTQDQSVIDRREDLIDEDFGLHVWPKFAPRLGPFDRGNNLAAPDEDVAIQEFFEYRRITLPFRKELGRNLTELAPKLHDQALHAVANFVLKGLLVPVRHGKRQPLDEECEHEGRLGRPPLVERGLSHACLLGHGFHREIPHGHRL